MSRFHSYLNSAAGILERYQGEMPFATYIKSFFSANKKYGSKDRRTISTLCYHYFRAGWLLRKLPIQEGLLVATYLCEQSPTELLQQLQPALNATIAEPVANKLTIAGYQADGLFPFSQLFSEGIDATSLATAMLQQPALYLRIRPQCRQTTLRKLERSKLPYKMVREDAVALPPQTDVDAFFVVNKEVVVQDLQSQLVLDFFLSSLEQQTILPGKSLKVWDCCAASGGKSILLTDRINRKIQLTVSDVRASIILNLHQRFLRAGIKEYQYFIADVSDPKAVLTDDLFNLVICDVPCSGSGTWSRTPEQLYHFDPSTLASFSKRQLAIATNASSRLSGGGVLLYITCSVFTAENEAVVEQLIKQTGLSLLHQQTLPGYHHQADSMFVAYLQKSNSA